MADTVEGNSTVDSNQWKSEEFRGKIKNQIQETMDKTDIPVPKTSAELEEQIFGKASTREEYLNLAARIIVHIRDLRTRPAPTIPPAENSTTIEPATTES